jgi:WD40 repeat protein/serine/threonine protein kinase
MATRDEKSDYSPVDRLAEEFLERYRRGDRPALTEYKALYPELREQVDDLFPALIEMEQFGSVDPAPTGTATQAGAPPTAPRQLGDYRILRVIGRGGMGVVYEAVQESLGRRVALKVLPGGALHNPQSVLRFTREARSAARLHHANIVPVFGVGEQEGLHYYVMQFIQGQSLDAVLEELRRLRRSQSAGAGALPAVEDDQRGCKRSAHEVSAAAVARSLLSGQFALHGPDPGAVGGAPTREGEPPQASSMSLDLIRPPTATATDPGPEQAETSAVPPASGDRSTAVSLPDQAGLSPISGSGRAYWQGVARVGWQVAEALAYAHGQRILHRDIKPSNLLLDLHGTVWVTDFGLAKAMADDDLTHSNDVVGTLRYMAPERFSGRADARSDIYALGLTLYELLTLRPAFDETDRNRLIRQVTEGTPPGPRKLVPEVPRDLETICLKCLERQPSRRYVSAGALAEDLDRWLEGRPIAARRVSPLERAVKWARRKPALAGLLAISTASLLGGLLLVGWYNIQLSRALAEALRQQRRAERGAYIANVNLIRRSIEVGDVAGALAGLDALGRARGGPEGRGFEWHYLRRLCDYELRGRWETGTPVESLAYSPDGTRIVTGHGYGTHQGFEDRPGEVQVRDAAAGRPLLRFEAHRGPVFDVAFSPDGRTIATAGADRSAKLWDAATGRLLHTLGRHPFEVNGVAFSPDGRWVATASGSRYTPLAGLRLEAIPPGEVAVWDAATGRNVWREGVSRGAMHSALFAPDGSRLAAGGFPEFLTFYDPATGRVLDHRVGRVGRPCDYSTDGRWLITCNGLSSPTVWDTSAGLTPRIIDIGHDPSGRTSRQASVSDAIFQPHAPDYMALSRGRISPEAPADAGRLARRASVDVADSRGNLLYSLDAHKAVVRGLAFRPDGRRLASADRDGTVAVWEPFQAKPAADTRPFPRGVRVVAFRPDGRQLAAAGEDGGVRLDDLDSAGPRVAREGHGLAALALAYSADGRQLASGGQDATILIGPPDGHVSPRALTGHTGPVYGLAFRPDGRRLASAGGDGTVRLWDPHGGREVRVLSGHSGTVLGVAYAPDGRRLASVGGDGIVRLWEGDSGRPLLSWPAHAGTIYATTFLGLDGSTLATAGADSAVRLWDAADGRLIRELKGHARDVLALAWGGVGQPRLVSAGRDRTVRLWDPETGQGVLTLSGHDGDVRSVAFSPDGLRLATAGEGRPVLLWEARPSTFVTPPGPEGTSSLSANPDR